MKNMNVLHAVLFLVTGQIFTVHIKMAPVSRDMTSRDTHLPITAVTPTSSSVDENTKGVRTLADFTNMENNYSNHSTKVETRTAETIATTPAATPTDSGSSVSSSRAQLLSKVIGTVPFGNVVIECVLSPPHREGHDVPSDLMYRWYKNGISLNNNKSVLRITKIQESDFGVYECEEDKLTSKLNEVANVKRNFRQNKGAFYLYPPPVLHMIYKEGFQMNPPSLMLFCETEVPPPLYFKWFSEDMVLLGVFNKVYFVNFDPHHERGSYRCAVVTGGIPELLVSTQKSFSVAKGSEFMFSFGLCSAASFLAVYLQNNN